MVQEMKVGAFGHCRFQKGWSAFIFRNFNAYITSKLDMVFIISFL